MIEIIKKNRKPSSDVSIKAYIVGVGDKVHSMRYIWQNVFHTEKEKSWFIKCNSAILVLIKIVLHAGSGQIVIISPNKTQRSENVKVRNSE